MREGIGRTMCKEEWIVIIIDEAADPCYEQCVDTKHFESYDEAKAFYDKYDVLFEHVILTKAVEFKYAES